MLGARCFQMPSCDINTGAIAASANAFAAEEYKRKDSQRVQKGWGGGEGVPTEPAPAMTHSSVMRRWTHPQRD